MRVSWRNGHIIHAPLVTVGVPSCSRTRLLYRTRSKYATLRGRDFISWTEQAVAVLSGAINAKLMWDVHMVARNIQDALRCPPVDLHPYHWRFISVEPSCYQPPYPLHLVALPLGNPSFRWHGTTAAITSPHWVRPLAWHSSNISIMKLTAPNTRTCSCRAWS